MLPASSCRLLWFLLNKLVSLFTIIQEGKTLKAKCYSSAKVKGQKITKILFSKVVDNYAFKHLLHISNSPTVDGADRSYIQE